MESLLKVTVYDIENGEPLVLSVRCPVETPFRVKSLALYGMLFEAGFREDTHYDIEEYIVAKEKEE